MLTKLTNIVYEKYILVVRAKQKNKYLLIQIYIQLISLQLNPANLCLFYFMSVTKFILLCVYCVTKAMLYVLRYVVSTLLSSLWCRSILCSS